MTAFFGMLGIAVLIVWPIAEWADRRRIKKLGPPPPGVVFVRKP
ncbi:MAG: hypothetical protein ACTHJM_16095 [Marmoricola sp.]